MNKASKGFILFPVLFMVLLLTGLGKLMLLLMQEECDGQQQYLRHRQLYRLCTELFTALDGQGNKIGSGMYTLPTMKFYPGKESINPVLERNVKSGQQLQRTALSFPWRDGRWTFQKLTVVVPGGPAHPLYVQAGSTGALEQAGQLPALQQELFHRYQTLAAPTDKSHFQEGLGDALYVHKKGNYKVPAYLYVQGNGVFYSAGDISIKAHTKFTGRVWFLAKNNIIVGDNVDLKQSFLYAENNITLGSKSKVCGIIIAHNKINLESGALVKPQIAVLKTFATPIYFY